MADRDPEQDNLFKEIDEELRHEHYAKLWKKYGNFVIGAAVVLVLSVASFQGWKSYDLNRRTESSQLFTSAIKAVSADKPDEATGILAKLAVEGSSGYAILSQSWQKKATPRERHRPIGRYPRILQCRRFTAIWR